MVSLGLTWPHLVFTSISLPSHFDVTSISLPSHFDVTSMSLRFHFDVTSMSLRCHFDFTSSSLRRHFNFTSIQKGKGKASRCQRGKGKVGEGTFSLIFTWQPNRAHARTNETNSQLDSLSISGVEPIGAKRG